jgi:excisionase family DNA binding protein
MSAAPALTDRERAALGWEATRVELRRARRDVHFYTAADFADDDSRADAQPAPAPAPRAVPEPQGRLLDDVQAAQYLGCSRSLVRAYVARGVLKRVALPAAADGKRGARLLRIDRADLDKFIEQHKEIAS